MNPDARRLPWRGRVEDDRLLRGLGKFGDDFRDHDIAFAAFVRSPQAFAKIQSLDVSQARTLPGVLAVVTGADLVAAQYSSVTRPYPLDGCEDVVAPYRPALAVDRVVHVGEPVAIVVAESPTSAQDAAEAVYVEYEQLEPISGAIEALQARASQIWPAAASNVVLDYWAPQGQPEEVKAELDRCFKEAAHVASLSLTNQRVAAVSMEPRVATAFYDPSGGLFTLRCGSQGVAQIQREVCASMGVSSEQLRVLSFDVGGGFGMKASSYPEYIALLHVARLLQRPVHWSSTRSEAFQSDNQARDSIWQGDLAVDRNGRFLALRIEVLSDVGAYLTGVGHYCATRHVAECLPSIYDIPYASLHTRCLFSNKAPVGPYRGAGRPETNYFLERLIDEASKVSGIDPAAVRRKNIIPPEKLPLTTKFGTVYDSGDFPAVLDRALEAADYQDFQSRRETSRKSGLLRGIGIGCYLENAGAFPEETTKVIFSGGRVSLSIGAGSTGQGHETVFRELLAERLGIDVELVSVSSGDTSRDAHGFGAVASRTAMMVGGATANAVSQIISKGSEVAALLLQRPVGEIKYERGTFSTEHQSLSLLEVATRSQELASSGIIKESLDTTASVNAPSSFPNGCHVAEVEIDPQTGSVSVVSYVGVDDCGRVLNPTIVEGQFHGGVAQGLGQALSEAVIYEPGTGQLNSASFLDYGLPRARALPEMKAIHVEVPCPTNPLGVKGAGESGTTAAPCAIINAIANALPAQAAARLQMPATAESVWRALHFDQ